MQKHIIKEDIKVFGIQVQNLPEGIGEAFNLLKQHLPAADSRPLYGICHCTPGNIVYKATAPELFDGEGKQLGFEYFTVERGSYLAASLSNWQANIGAIRDVFEELSKQPLADNTQPLVEVYTNESEMLCMVKIDSNKELAAEVDNALNQFIQVLEGVNQNLIDVSAFEGSWSAGQVAEHLIKAHSGFYQLLNGPVADTERNIDEHVAMMRNSFLDFTIKMEAPEFVRPTETIHQKQELIQSLQQVKDNLTRSIQSLDLSKTCTGHKLPGSGYLTRLEAATFVLYHTLRHTHQLKNIQQQIQSNSIVSHAL